MNSFMLIIVLISLLVLSGVTIYYLYDYLNYKKNIKDSIDNTRASLQTESTDRLATYSSVVDQINTINYDIHNRVTSNFGDIDPIQQKVEKTIDTLLQIRDTTGKTIPLSNVTNNLPNNATYNFSKNIGVKKGMNITNLDKSGNKFVITGQDLGTNSSNIISLPDEYGNTVIQNIDQTGNLVFLNHDNNKNIVLDGTTKINNDILLNELNGKKNIINTKSKSPLIISSQSDLTNGTMYGDNTIYGNKIGLFSRGNGFSIGAGADIINNEISLFVDNVGGLNLYKPINLYDPVSKKLYATIATTEEKDLVFQAVNNIVLNTGKEIKNLNTTEVDDITVKQLKGSVLPPGPIGDRGSQGLQGPQGSQGTEKGPMGSAGIQGEPGLNGLTGAVGLQGSMGIRGPTGIQGTPGEIGDSYGTPGEKGPIGSRGLQGQRGSIGELTLIQGSQGSQGIKGVKGELTIGDQGIQGSQGSQGRIGSQGIRGIFGEDGLQGSQGRLGSIGTPAPRGERGIQGSQGSVGKLGSRGLPSDKGDQGIQGSQGSQGRIGSRGIQGNAGLPGYRGSIQGSRGSQGIQGSKGSYKGERGSQGLPNIGSRGPLGPRGSAGIYYNSATTPATGTGSIDPNTGLPMSVVNQYYSSGYSLLQSVDGTWNFVNNNTGQTIPVSTILQSGATASASGGLINTNVPTIGTQLSSYTGIGSVAYSSSIITPISVAMNLPPSQTNIFLNLNTQQQVDFLNNYYTFSQLQSISSALTSVGIFIPGINSSSSPSGAGASASASAYASASTTPSTPSGGLADLLALLSGYANSPSGTGTASSRAGSASTPPSGTGTTSTPPSGTGTTSTPPSGTGTPSTPPSGTGTASASASRPLTALEQLALTLSQFLK